MADPAHAPDPGQRSPGRRPGSTPGGSSPSTRGRPATAIITDARSASSQEISGRMRRYAITMAFRTACFVSMVFVQGWLRWALLAGAVLLPYIAVVLANQSDQRSKGSRVEQGAPVDAPQLTVGDDVRVVDGEVVTGSVVEDDDLEDGRAEDRDDRLEGRVA